MKYLSACIALFSLSVFGQPAVPTTFPDGAVLATAEQLKARLTDRVFGAQMTNGDRWRFEWKSNGYFFLNAGGGYSDTGKWRVEEGKICAEMKKSGPACSEMRLVNDVLYMKRASNGEVVALQPN